MFEKDLTVAYLLDFYGDILSEHTRSALDAYYNEDLSLSEIAAGTGISRQGVRHLIKRGEEQLYTLEDRLGLAARFDIVRRQAARLSEISSMLCASCPPALLPLCREVEQCASAILSAEEKEKSDV